MHAESPPPRLGIFGVLTIGKTANSCRRHRRRALVESHVALDPCDGVATQGDLANTLS